MRQQSRPTTTRLPSSFAERHHCHDPHSPPSPDDLRCSYIVPCTGSSRRKRHCSEAYRRQGQRRRIAGN
jgi:hypothetical protein